MITPATGLAFSSPFNWRQLDTLLYGGEPAWLAGQVGDHLEYAHAGSRLCTLIRADWREDFVEGEQIHYLTGERLAAFKRALPAGDEIVDPRTSRILLLTESGLDRVLLKSDKGLRVPFRRFLETEVLPRLRPEAEPPDESPHVASVIVLHAIPPVAAPATREERLSDQLDLRERIFRSGALRETVRVLHALEQVDDTVRAAYEVRAAEIALGEDLPDLRPEPADRWYTASDIARATGMTPAVIGRVITTLGIRGAPGLSKQVVTTTPDDDKTVLSYVYTERARALILGACGGSTPPGRAA